MRSYYDAVAEGDPAAAARHFAVPSTFITMRGTWLPTTAAQIETAFADMLRDFKAQAYSHSTWSEAHIKLLGDATALVSLVVVRHRMDRTQIGTYGFTYLLRKVDGAWKIATLIGHPPEDVLRVT